MTIAKTKDGYDTALMTDNGGHLLISPGSQFPPTDQVVTHIGTAGDYLIHNTMCLLFGFTSNASANKATMAIYDGIDDTGRLIGNFDISGVLPMSFPGGGLYLGRGLFIHVAVDADITVVSIDMSPYLETSQQ